MKDNEHIIFVNDAVKELKNYTTNLVDTCVKLRNERMRKSFEVKRYRDALEKIKDLPGVRYDEASVIAETALDLKEFEKLFKTRL